MTVHIARFESWPSSLVAAVATATVVFVATLCACGPPDVDNQRIPTPPQVGDTQFDGTVPGSTHPYFHPVDLDAATCPEPQASIIMWGGVSANGAAPPAPKINRLNGPTNNQLIAFWTVCNQGKTPQPAGASYVLTTSLRTTDRDFPPSSGPPFLTETPFTDSARSPVLPIPALAKCTCFVQQVGINMDVPATTGPQGGAEDQRTLQGLNFLFPRINLEPRPPNTAENQTFQYVQTLPLNFGTQELVFTVL